MVNNVQNLVNVVFEQPLTDVPYKYYRIFYDTKASILLPIQLYIMQYKLAIAGYS